ncbi:hypothetical protein OYC64_019189 [Pagothenia borchgrevinki]|uniref:V-SNARE coiled-coil homology domain-containing protein n=1 Tax=Pagothenia borchgrevinki TaxID=8213 RepID=A0ABD2GU26_PAGBO
MADTRSQPRASGSAAKMDQLQSQVNEVKVILTDEISKRLEREDRLDDDLIGRAEALHVSAASFEKTPGRVARKYWWKSMCCGGTADGN